MLVANQCFCVFRSLPSHVRRQQASLSPIDLQGEDQWHVTSMHVSPWLPSYCQCCLYPHVS